MRYLNKIAFINSAAIRYSEVQLDGNIHLIGTQGVGKSTILRAILFFYNADTQRLGIPVEKKSYQDYYFPYADSSIIYEVAREDGWFTVLSYLLPFYRLSVPAGSFYRRGGSALSVGSYPLGAR